MSSRAHGLLIAIIVTFGGCRRDASSPTDIPSIPRIVSDDQSWGDPGAYGRGHSHTANRLACA
jgi:hypothetical protein